MSSLCAVYSSAYAIRESRPTAIDSRIRVIAYTPNDVFKYTGYYGYQASIEFAPTEEIINISMGDTTGWTILPNGNRLFLKPIEKDATTNMTLITNKRTYFFELYAEEAASIRDPDMVFNVKFLYPDEEESEDIHNYHAHSSAASGTIPDLAHPENLNFNYTISGNEEIAPIKIFDDGEFTYLQFRDKNKVIPAIFAVDEELRESMVNSKIDSKIENLVIVEQVFHKIALRHGDKVLCIFNESFRPY